MDPDPLFSRQIPDPDKNKMDPKPVLRIRIRWIRRILASWIRISKNMPIHGSGSTKNAKKNKSERLKKEIRISSYLVHQVLG